MYTKRIYGKTPSDGDYSEIFYLDVNGNCVEASKAVRCVIRECLIDGTLIQETWGVLANKPPSDEGGVSEADGGRERVKEYNKDNIPLAKVLRKNMTPWERKLWYEFLRAYPVRFQRQKAIGNYIADFYCAKARLVIELDGGGHYTAAQAEKDLLRVKELEKMNLSVLRICNLDIDRNFSGVCEYIDLTVKNALA